MIILYDLATGEPLAFMHETHLSGFRVGATTGLAVAEAARADAQVLGLFGTGLQAFPNCRAICAVRPIRRVKVFSPSRAASRRLRRAHGERAVRGRRGRRSARRGARRRHRVLRHQFQGAGVRGEWLEPGQMVVIIANSDVLGTRREVDETTFARASDIIINDWDERDRQPPGRAHSSRSRKAWCGARTCTSSAISSPAKPRLAGERDPILYYKNNTGLAIQFAACGAILYRKLKAEGTNRTIPREWFAGSQYGL